MTWNTSKPVVFSNISATPAAFTLLAGQYGVMVMGSGFGTVTLQRMALDGSTFVTVLTAFAANGYATVNLPSGTYQLTIATTTAVYAEIIPVVLA